jgi:NAD-dependent SIR2 family protein deacetylase
MLHSSAGVEDDRLHEIHGSLGYLQCANQCCDVLYPADEAFRQRLRDEPEWIPRCPVCEQSCLRPNVMIFQDDKFVDARLRRQRANKDAFNTKIEAGNLAVLEVGAVRPTNASFAIQQFAFILVFAR